jgi:hypothetical protein
VEAFHLYGLPFGIGHLYTILRNHFYRGQIKHTALQKIHFSNDRF